MVHFYHNAAKNRALNVAISDFGTEGKNQETWY